MAKRKDIRPKSIKVGIFTYDIVFLDLDTFNLHGVTDINNRVIKINTKYSEISQKETLLHEILHAGFEDCPIFKQAYEDANEKEEDTIRFLSPRLYGILNDNPTLRRYLFGK